jgi:PAS domain S-box-containing protein
MKNLLEKKFEILIKQLNNLPHNGGSVSRQTEKPLIDLKKIIGLAEEIRTAEKQIVRQKEELLFAYQTLEVAYQRYWELFNYAPDGYLVTDTDGTIREANETSLSMLSLSKNQALGKPITTLIPEVRQQDFGMQLNWFSGSQQLEMHLQPQGRAPFFASLSIAPQRNVQNMPIGLLWLFRDITERKEMEEALRKSRAELGLILEQMPCVLWTTDTELKIISVSGTRMNVIHSVPEDIIGQNIQNYFSDKLYQNLLEAHRKALSGASQTCEFEWNAHIFQSTIEALKDVNGRITGVIGAAFDITERKQAEKTLQKSEKFNSSLLDKSPNPILVINADTSIGYVNPAFEKLTGFSARRTIGQKAPYPWWNESHKPVDRFKKSLCKNSRKRETEFRKKNGDSFWVDVTTIWIKNEDEPGYHLQDWVDITEAKHLRENMEFYIMQISRIQEEERQRIAQELHEETLQSLAALCLATEAIIKSRELNPGDPAKDLKELRGKINSVIEEVRRFSYDLRPGDLDYLGLTAALESLVEDMNGKGIKTHLNITGQEKALSPDMQINLFRIAQEACSNIKKYSGAEEVNIGVQYSRKKIKLTIEDNGQGFQVPDRLTDFANQRKLGLIGMEERARLYGGFFSIQSEPKKGTRVSINLPMSGEAK